MLPYVEDAIGLFVIAFVGAILFRRWLDRQARKAVYGIPKIPMKLCDKHGLIPLDATLKTTAVAVGRPDLEIEHCPICMGERVKSVEALLK